MQYGQLFVNYTSYENVSAFGSSKPQKYDDRMVFLLS